MMPRRKSRNHKVVRPSDAHLEELEDLPTTEGTAKAILGRGELKDLYDSDLWEFPWDRSVERCWKSQRQTQYK
jgi:hypothetical protein